jgi:hypothetical protein
VLLDERGELADQLAVTPEREVGLDPVLQRRQTQLLEARDGRLRERLIAEIGQRGAAPQPESVTQQYDRPRRIAGGERLTSLLDQRAKAVDVELAVRDPQQVAAAAGDQDTAVRGTVNLAAPVLQQLAEPVDVSL